MSNSEKVYSFTSEDFMGTEPLTMIDVIDDLQTDRDQWKSKYMYLLADYDNVKKNSQKRIDNITKYGTKKIISDILSVIDDFERCLSNLPTNIKECDTEGIKLIYTNLTNILSSYGLTEISPVNGETFDVNYHEAVSAINTDNEEEKGKISVCINKGYMLKDEVIRYAKVIVYQNN